MGKKVAFPKELRGGKIGKEWYDDCEHAKKQQIFEEKVGKQQAIFSNLLKDKLEEAFRKAREANQRRKGEIHEKANAPS